MKTQNLKVQFDPGEGRYSTSTSSSDQHIPSYPNGQRTQPTIQPNGTSSTRSSQASELITNGNQSKWQGSIWPFLLLFASLVFSVANTMLISYVFRVIQSTDEVSQFEGKLSWDPTTGSNILNIPAIGRSIKVGSIEGLDAAGPMEILVSFESLSELAKDGQSLLNFKFIEQQDYENDTSTSLINDRKHRNSGNNHLAYTNVNSHVNTQGAKGLSSEQNHDDDDDYDNDGPGMLKLGANRFYMNRFIGQSNDLKKGPGNRQEIIRLLELDTVKASVSLPMQIDLNQGNSIISQGIQAEQKVAMVSDGLDDEKKPPTNHQEGQQVTINDRLVCPHLVGSFEKDLEVQTRRGNLICQAAEGIMLKSKSGDAKLSLYNQMKMNAHEIELDSSKLLLTKGVTYLDSPPTMEVSRDGPGREKEEGVGEEETSEATDLILLGDQLVVGDSKH